MKKKCNRMLLAVSLVLCICSLTGCDYRPKTIELCDHLEDTAVTVDEQVYPMRELVFYIAHEEKTVDEQAQLYNPEDPKQYWNAHMNGHFVRVRARQEAMNLAVHDFIFYQLALELGMELTDEEIEYATTKAQDFWDDLGEYGQAGICIDEDALIDDILRMALAQKYQELYAAMADAKSEDCDVSGMVYEKLLEEHTYKINEKVWDAIPMGSVTLE